MARSSKKCGPAKSSARKKKNGGSAPTSPGRIFPPTEPERGAKFRCSFSKPCKAHYARVLIPLRGPLLHGTGSPRKELRDEILDLFCRDSMHFRADPLLFPFLARSRASIIAARFSMATLETQFTKAIGTR